MILESIIIIGLAILLDLILGDPKNRYHPTAWIGNLIGVITTRMKNENYIIEKFGGKTSNSVSKNTNFLVSGENPGSKLATAITLNIPILTEEDFLQYLKDHNI